MSLEERERQVEWAAGFREGYRTGFTQGRTIGYSEGWDSAKWRAYEAQDAKNVKAALSQHLGELAGKDEAA